MVDPRDLEQGSSAQSSRLQASPSFLAGIDPGAVDVNVVDSTGRPVEEGGLLGSFARVDAGAPAGSFRQPPEIRKTSSFHCMEDVGNWLENSSRSHVAVWHRACYEYRHELTGWASTATDGGPSPLQARALALLGV